MKKTKDSSLWQRAFNAALGNTTSPTQGDISRACVNPQPVRLFFAQFLGQDLKAVGDDYFLMLREEGIIPQEKRSHIKTSPVSAARPRKQWEHALTRKQADTAAASMSDPLLRRTAAVIQTGLTAYYINVSSNLDGDWPDSPEEKNKIIRIGIYVQSVWDDFLPFLAYSHATRPDDDHNFQDTFRLAHDNHAFQSDDGEKQMTCPAQFMLKHLLNTDYIRKPDGSLIIGQKARPGALPSFIYETLKKEALPSPQPGTM